MTVTSIVFTPSTGDGAVVTVRTHAIAAIVLAIILRSATVRVAFGMETGKCGRKPPQCAVAMNGYTLDTTQTALL